MEWIKFFGSRNIYAGHKRFSRMPQSKFCFSEKIHDVNEFISFFTFLISRKARETNLEQWASSNECVFLSFRSISIRRQWLLPNTADFKQSDDNDSVFVFPVPCATSYSQCQPFGKIFERNCEFTRAIRTINCEQISDTLISRRYDWICTMWYQEILSRILGYIYIQRANFNDSYGAHAQCACVMHGLWVWTQSQKRVAKRTANNCKTVVRYGEDMLNIFSKAFEWCCSSY